jgi:Flp pilus assembly secretin CpaC
VTTLTSSISSPIFSERHVVSCLAMQDGQTFGVAALTTENVSYGIFGIPFLKNIRLLRLIRPHVRHDQRDARAC